MEIWLVSLFDPTPIDDPISPRFYGIGLTANSKNISVVHFSSTFRHSKKRHRFDENKELQIHEKYKLVLLKSMGYKKNMMPRRYIAHDDFAKKLINNFNNRSTKPDIIFVSMPPLSTAYRISKWCELHGVPYVVDIIDPWPDPFIKDIPTKLKPFVKIFLRPFYKKAEFIFEKANAITAISNEYLNWSKNYFRGQKVLRPFYLTVDLDKIYVEVEKYRKERKDHDILRLIYAGSIASSYDIPSILKAAEYFHKNFPGRTNFVITGFGPEKRQNLIKDYMTSCPNIQYLGYLPSDELLRQYALSDIGLIQHVNSSTQTITYKFFNYMSAGMALLNSLQSEMAELIEKHNLGLNNKEQDVAKLISNIQTYLNDPELLKTHKDNALRFTRKYGDSKSVYGDLIDLLLERVTDYKSKLKT
jgi:glycosyltransferase involved in cell wall biosynthesis